MTNRDGRRVTITAIADEAGVSAPTVSRVLNGRSDVSPQTRDRITELLRQHGYRRRQSHTRGSAGLLDLVFNDLDSPWAVEIIRGVEDTAHEECVGTVVSAIHRRSASATEWMRNVRTRSTDAVILVTSLLDPPLQVELRRLHVPLVVVDPAGATVYEVPTIGATNWSGGLSATEHLVSLGHRRIGFVTGPERLRCSAARYGGYRAALDAAGIPVDDALVRPGDFYHASGFTAGTALLTLDEPPTAIFAASDQMAFGVYEAIRQRGLRVPDDVSVVGFDDLPEARWFSPPLTTVRQPLVQMGRTAVVTALQLARNATAQVPGVELATELLVRDSTGPAPVS